MSYAIIFRSSVVLFRFDVLRSTSLGSLLGFKTYYSQVLVSTLLFNTHEESPTLPIPCDPNEDQEMVIIRLHITSVCTDQMNTWMWVKERRKREDDKRGVVLST